ncbi:MAG TPA: DoxX family protein [Opitutaceae bacterium]|nr:DoxX family protein [Opitutaceae bacterium]HRJ48510.1 DoxX family protein [Opitutaceae bacterium]
MKHLNLNFLPQSTDLALLVLRVWLGLSMLLLHGWGKLVNLINGTSKFPDLLGLGQTPTLILVIFAEVGCAALLVAGIYTRFCALVLAITMGVAYFVAHGAKLSGPGNGELAFIFLAGFVALVVAGGGRFGFDRKLGAKG